MTDQNMPRPKITRRRTRRVTGTLCVVFIFLITVNAMALAKRINAKKRIYAPYLFVHDAGATPQGAASPNTTSPGNDIVGMSRQSGIKFFTLAFVVSSGGDCQAVWFPSLPLPQETSMAAQIFQLRKQGGDVILSFGGEDGLELAQTCKDVPSLQAQYQAAIDKYKVHMLDFDIESSAILDPDSIDRRNQALANLQASNPSLLISYTLGVLPTGLLTHGVDLLKNATLHGVVIGNVNIMTMDYSAGFDPNAMGQNAIEAANATIKQLQALNIDAPLGLTPMIGMNDVSLEVFTLDDAEKLTRFAKSNSRVRRVAMWSVERDQPCPAAQAVRPDCSGVPQARFSFSRLFGKF